MWDLSPEFIYSDVILSEGEKPFVDPHGASSSLGHLDIESKRSILWLFSSRHGLQRFLVPARTPAWMHFAGVCAAATSLSAPVTPHLKYYTFFSLQFSNEIEHKCIFISASPQGFICSPHFGEGFINPIFCPQQKHHRRSKQRRNKYFDIPGSSDGETFGECWWWIQKSYLLYILLKCFWMKLIKERLARARAARSNGRVSLLLLMGGKLIRFLIDELVDKLW